MLDKVPWSDKMNIEMKKEQAVKIRDRIWAEAWNEYKNEYTMQEMAGILGTSLPTFFRAIKKVEEAKSSKKLKKIKCHE